MAAARSVALNAVRAKPVKRAEDGCGSSVRARLARRDNGLVAALCGGEKIGRPLGSPAFLDRVATPATRGATRRGPKRGEASGVESTVAVMP